MLDGQANSNLRLVPFDHIDQNWFDENQFIVWTSDMDEIDFLANTHPLYFVEQKKYGFILPTTGGRIDTGHERYTSWRVENLPDNKKRINITIRQPNSWQYLFIDINDNHVLSVTYKMGLNVGYAMVAPIYGLLVPVLVYLACIVILVIKELHTVFFGVHRYTVDSNR